MARIQKYQAEQMHYNAIAVKHALEAAGYKIYGLPLQGSKPYTRSGAPFFFRQTFPKT